MQRRFLATSNALRRLPRVFQCLQKKRSYKNVLLFVYPPCCYLLARMRCSVHALKATKTHKNVAAPLPCDNDRSKAVRTAQCVIYDAFKRVKGTCETESTSYLSPLSVLGRITTLQSVDDSAKA